MGTYTHTLVTLVAAYNHPLLPSETQYVVCKPTSVNVKRTLGSAITRDERVGWEMLRCGMAEEWEYVGDKGRNGKWRDVRRGLESMVKQLEKWKAQRNGDVGAEFLEMREEIIKELEVVMEKILWEEKIEMKSGIALPPPARTKGGIYPRRQHPQPSTSTTASRKPHVSRSVNTSVSSGDKSYSSASEKSIKSTKSLPAPKLPIPPPSVQGNRKESEKLVEEAIVRGQPVTLFNTLFASPSIAPTTPPTPPSPPPQSTPPPNKDEQYIHDTSTAQYPRNTTSSSRDRDVDVISLRSVMTLDQKYPFTPHRHRSRDITPTPTDPFGLRKDPKLSSTPTSPSPLNSIPTSTRPPGTAVMTPSPRKRAALYNTPRWPRSGRPSPSSPASIVERNPSKTPLDTKEKRRLETRDTRDSRGSEFGEDPAEAIWKGIDEEYMSPDAGRFKLKRRLRRKASVRTEFGG